MTIRPYQPTGEYAIGFGVDLRVARKREDNSMSIKQVADLTRGEPHWLNSSALGQIERGCRVPTREQAELLMKTLGFHSRYVDLIHQVRPLGPTPQERPAIANTQIRLVTDADSEPTDELETLRALAGITGRPRLSWDPRLPERVWWFIHDDNLEIAHHEILALRWAKQIHDEENVPMPRPRECYLRAVLEHLVFEHSDGV